MEEQRDVALWKLLVGLAAMAVGIGTVDDLGGWYTIVIGGLIVGGFVYAGWRWGRDSRDGADWHPKSRRATPDADEEAAVLDG